MNNLKVTGKQEFMGKEIPVVLGGFGEDKRCLCDKTIGEIHNQPEREIRKSILRSIARFNENIDYIDLKSPSSDDDLEKGGNEITTSELLEQLGYSKQQITQAQHIYLLSERGYAKLIKIMDSDLAWEIHDKLIDEYFQLREEAKFNMEDMFTNPDTLIRLATNWKEECEKNKVLQIENVQQKQIIGELKPKADYTDRILKNKSLVTITQIAKDYGMSGQAMNKKLFELGVQYKQKEQWLLYAKYHDKGYTHSETVSIAYADGTTGTKMNTEWTQKGRLFLYELLKKEGILPVIEREEEEQYKEMFTC